MSNTGEALVLEATLNLCHRAKDKVLVGEIATELNSMMERAANV